MQKNEKSRLFSPITRGAIFALLLALAFVVVGCSEAGNSSSDAVPTQPTSGDDGTNDGDDSGDTGDTGDTSADGDSFESDDTYSEATTYVIGTDGTQERTFHDSGDEDWVIVNAASGTWFTIETMIDGPGVDTELVLFDPDGDNVAYNDDYAGGTVYSKIVYQTDRTGDHYIQIRELERLTGSYKFKIDSGGSNTISPDSYEPDNRKDDATSYTLGSGAQNHTIHRLGDQDWISFYLNAGTTYTIKTTAPTSGDRTDTWLLLFDDSSLESIEDTDNYEEDVEIFDETISFTPTNSGTYYALVRRMGGNGDSYGFQIE